MLSMNKDKALETLQKIDEAIQKVPSLNLKELNPKETLLVVADMVNGFVKEGLLSSPRVAAIIEPIADLMQKSKQAGISMVAFADSHPKESPELKVYGEHCLAGSQEAEIIDELKEIGGFGVISKNSTNGFLESAFQELLKRGQYKNFIVVGDCTDICVEHFTITLKAYFNMTNKHIRVIVPLNCVATFDYDIHYGDFFNTLGLFNMMRNGIEVVQEVR